MVSSHQASKMMLEKSAVLPRLLGCVWSVLTSVWTCDFLEGATDYMLRMSSCRSRVVINALGAPIRGLGQCCQIVARSAIADKWPTNEHPCFEGSIFPSRSFDRLGRCVLHMLGICYDASHQRTWPWSAMMVGPPYRSHEEVTPESLTVQGNRARRACDARPPPR